MKFKFDSRAIYITGSPGSSVAIIRHTFKDKPTVTVGTFPTIKEALDFIKKHNGKEITI